MAFYDILGSFNYYIEAWHISTLRVTLMIAIRNHGFYGFFHLTCHPHDCSVLRTPAILHTFAYRVASHRFYAHVCGGSRKDVSWMCMHIALTSFVTPG